MEDYRFRHYCPTYSKPTVVRIGGKVLYRGKDAANWLREQKDRNIKACAKLRYS